MDESLTVQRIKKLMQARGRNASDIAEEVGITRSAMSVLLSGKRVQPRMDTLVGLAQTLGTSVDYLTGITDDPMPRRGGVDLPDYALEILDEMKSLDPSRGLELLRMVQAFTAAQKETASLRKAELAELLMGLAGDEAATLASALTALEEGQQGLGTITERLGDFAGVGN